jgi:hypothetical protein
MRGRLPTSYSIFRLHRSSSATPNVAVSALPNRTIIGMLDLSIAVICLI